MSLRHNRQEKLRRTAAFHAFALSNPPRLPMTANANERRRVLQYARIAFATGWNSGQKDMHRNGKRKSGSV